LRIRHQSGLASLDWRPVTNASAYRVEALGNVERCNWQIVSWPVTNSWAEPLTPTQRFYRVFARP
jgi:hypothetical protein